MNAELAPLLAALDAGAHTAFIRDDDAGWDDGRLLALLDSVHGVPIDLAAIPEALGPALAAELRARIDAGGVAVHQHGRAHANHETEGRRCEFGLARDGAAHRHDLLQSRARLREHLGERVEPWFTPPWNRVAPRVPALLSELGYGALSRDRSAPVQQALPELAVDLDWTRAHRAGGPAAVIDGWVRALVPGRPFGLMLHHAVMDDGERATLAHWLRTLACHPHLRWVSMREALAC